MQTNPNPAFEALVGKIRDELEQYGEASVRPMELQALVGEASARRQWDVIAKIAIDENWSFTFFPNGTVRYAKISSKEDS